MNWLIYHREDLAPHRRGQTLGKVSGADLLPEHLDDFRVADVVLFVDGRRAQLMKNRDGSTLTKELTKWLMAATAKEGTT